MVDFTETYSPANCRLIASQCPEATDVRPLSAWNEAGRKVIKGAKSIQIFVPKEGRDRSPGADPDATHTYFRMGKVFDVSQTETIAEWEARTGKTWQARAKRADWRPERQAA